MRDFIHVVDLAKAHLAAIQAMHDESLPSRNNTYKFVFLFVFFNVRCDLLRRLMG